MRQEHIERGLIPTNNLYAYFFKDSQPYLKSGFSNAYYYPGQPFGPVFEAFREANPELWQEAEDATEKNHASLYDLTMLREKQRRVSSRISYQRNELKVMRNILNRVLKLSPQKVALAETYGLLGGLRESGRQATEQAYWEEVEVFTRVFKILAPELEAAGINPLDVCV